MGKPPIEAGICRDGGIPPMDPYEKRFQAIEQDLSIIKSNYATKEDIANLKGDMANLKISMLVTSIGIVVSTVTILTAIQAVFF